MMRKSTRTMAGIRAGFEPDRIVRPATMARCARARRASPHALSRGQAAIALVVMLALATTLLVYGSTTALSRAVHGEQRTRATLEEARQALIGRAVSDASRPGSLPCPDGDGDGSADLFTGSSCPTYLGRLPWRTLGIGDLRDEHGERLWYALSPNFRDHPLAPDINSDTRGTLAVYSGADGTPLVSDAVAVILAAGTAVPGQMRDDHVETCSTSGRTVPRKLCATNYLDASGSRTNASTSGPFVIGAPAETFNDKLAFVSTAAFMPLLERRIALEVRNALLEYRRTSACRCFPWADTTGDGASDTGKSRGRLPVKNALPHIWPAGVLPSYVLANDWARVIHYVVGRDALEDAGRACATCSESTLSIDGASGTDVVILTPGFATGAKARTTLSDYLADPENHNADDRFVTPASPHVERGNIYGITGAAAGCPAIARVLVDNVPCAEPDGAIRATCRSAASIASGCACAAAAHALVQPPCAGTPNSAQCASAIAQLQRCQS